MQAAKYVSGDRTAMTNVLPRSAISSRATYRNALGLRRNQYPETDLGQLAFFFDLPVEAAKPETIIERLDGPTTMGEFIERWRTPIAAWAPSLRPDCRTMVGSMVGSRGDGGVETTLVEVEDATMVVGWTTTSPHPTIDPTMTTARWWREKHGTSFIFLFFLVGWWGPDQEFRNKEKKEKKRKNKREGNHLTTPPVVPSFGRPLSHRSSRK
jgi:hypothetical protein